MDASLQDYPLFIFCTSFFYQILLLYLSCYRFRYNLSGYQYQQIGIEMEQFFTEDPVQDTRTSHHQPSPTSDQEQQQFTYSTLTFSQLTTGTNSQPPIYQTESYSDSIYYQAQQIEQDQISKRIHQQEQMAQERLRKKRDEQYQLKVKRKQAGRLVLEEFNSKNLKELQDRKAQNFREDQKKLEDLKKMNKEAGWKNVTASVNLKQGEHKGSKDIARMRECLLHKREDLKSNQ